MRKHITKALILILVSVMVLSLMPTAALAAESKSEGLGVASRTVEEIRAFIAAHPAALNDPITYKTEPSLSEPYSPGVLSDETAASALNMLNQVRFIAGLHADVTLDEHYASLASAATLLNYLNKEVTHYPSRPGVLAGAAYDQLYEDGATGARSSNLGGGYGNLTEAIIRGWCADAGDIDSVGHRRWILNPSMGKTGFGYTESYIGVYAIDSSGSGGEYNVAWPAQMMPLEYFSASYPWSLSLSSSVNKDDVSVKLIRHSDNMTWNFSSGASDGEFYVNNVGYGTPGCIIFRPTSLSAIRNGDVFDVTVTIRSDSGLREIQYSVKFFSLGTPYIEDSTYPVTGGSLHFDSTAGAIVLCDPGVTEAVIPSEINGVPVTTIGPLAFWSGSIDGRGFLTNYDGSNLTRVTIPDSVTTIEDFAFYHCTSLASVNIPDSVTTIGNRAFYDCKSLTSLIIPGSVTSIGDHAFSNCAGLTSLIIPGSVTSIGERAFSNCVGLTSLTILDGVISIGDDAFSGCDRLTGVSIPASVTTIGKQSFHFCDYLKDVYYGGSESQWNQIDIAELDKMELTRATIHYNSAMPDVPSTPAAGISVTVNGAHVQWTDAAPFIDANDRTMVPLRAVGDAMGLNVNWDAAAREASFTGSGKTIIFPIDSTTARVSDGNSVQMDTAAVIASDRTYAPIRYLAEYFGYTVGWDAATRTVAITMPSGADYAFDLNIGTNLKDEDLSADITRKQFAQLVYGAYVAITGQRPPYGDPFVFKDMDDVTKIDGNALFANALGVMDPLDDGMFHGDYNITREEAAVMLNRLATACGAQVPDSSRMFTDGVGSSGPNDNYTIEETLVSMTLVYNYV